MHSILRLLCFTALIITPTVEAGKIDATLPSGLGVGAEYRPGEPGMPVLVILHGFLQTNQFQATRNIIDELSGSGYGILAPNLSLGVENRRKSLACGAMHRHTLNDDIAEIDFWVNWTLQRGPKDVIFIGHSWGAQHALAYLQTYAKRPVKGLIAVSLVRARQDLALLASQSALATELSRGDAPPLGPYELNFCKKYSGTPESYLSYADWTDDRAIEALQRVRVPVHVILGGGDKRSDPYWRQSLTETGATVQVIEGADHFFSSLYEFDLADALQTGLSGFQNVD